MAVSRNHKRDDSVAAWIGLLRGTVLAAAHPPEITPARRVGTTGIASVLEKSSTDRDSDRSQERSPCPAHQACEGFRKT